MTQFILRPARPTDVAIIFELIQALAEYENLSHAVTGSTAALEKHLFGSSAYAEVIISESGGQAVGFALFFPKYGAFLSEPGIYLEDLFVLPEFRLKGIGKAFLGYLAQLALQRGGRVLEWSVLDWNEPAIAFYHRMGASISQEARICRLTGNSLIQLTGGGCLWQLRTAVAKDLPVLWQFMQSLAEFTQQPQAFPVTMQALQEHLFGDSAHAEAVLAEQAGEIVGFATFLYNYSTFLTKPGLYLNDLCVSPKFQRRGLSQALLVYLAKLAVMRGCGRLELQVSKENSLATSFYPKIGASVLPDWRICQLRGDALAQLAALNFTN
ncbi:GNAT family N-acetyltransferase [Lyngbya aestuarii]|uniref:GNAT family N-acetyltransferase n=1 Tax=Lyngbya aestuarii TaxID=118322 RepID=UPI00403DD5C0